MSRRFSKSQRVAAELVADRQGEADHIMPHSRGGETAVENCQILTADENRRKGAFHFKPRKWQADFLERWEGRDPNIPFMLIAIPGGGKTFAALEACRRWMSRGADRRVIVVVPSDNLREQWKDEAARFGLSLQTKEFGTRFKHGFQGGVVTYHLVDKQRLLFRKLCAVSPVMVVFDEIHHCGDEAAFGDAVMDAFGLAKDRLLMSGTPWKSDGRPIPFVRYDGQGYAIGDYRYDYPDALTDDVVRYLVFDHARGSIRNDCTGDVEQLSQEVSDDDARQRLRKLLDPDGDYVREQIAAAHRKLIECRKSIPDAAALAACIDQSHAVKVARVIRDVTGSSPSLIVSDSELETDNVRRFRNSNTEWLVSVRKVSEGTDIKRLQVLCYLTNTTSELFFRQLVGRVSRVRGMEDFEAYVYLPADPRLIRCAQNIENAQVQALREQSEKESRELSERQQSTLTFDSYTTTHDGTDVVLIGSERVTQLQAKEIERIAEAVGVSMQKVMQVMAMSRGYQEAAVPSTATTEQPKEDRMDHLRRQCNKVAFRLSKLNDVHVASIHARFRKQEEMSEAELVAKLTMLTTECSRR